MSAEKTATGQTSDAATASQNQPAASPRKTGLLKKVLLTLGVVVVLFLGFVAAQPSEYRITRSATIAAPPAEVFPQVDNLHNWEAWSPGRTYPLPPRRVWFGRSHFKYSVLDARHRRLTSDGVPLGPDAPNQRMSLIRVRMARNSLAE